MRERIDAKGRMPNQQPGYCTAPDEAADRVAPCGADEGGEDEAGEEGYGEVVFVLEPDHCSVSLRNGGRAGTAESCQMDKEADEH